MRLSTSTNLLFYARQAGRVVSAGECVRLCAAAGYRVMDANLCENADPGCPLTRDDWEAWARDLRRTADAAGVVFSQSHNPIYNVVAPEHVPDFEWQEELTRRSMISAAILGVDWVVVHAGTAFRGGLYDREQTLSRNADYFGRMALQAAQLGLGGVAIENMAYLGPYSATLPPQLCAATEGLCALLRLLPDAHVGACWDFGHANLTHESQPDSLRALGSRLKATHINDNMGLADDHTLPFLGNIEWESVMPVLSEIGYTGDLTYEIHKYLRRMPEEMYPAMLATTLAVGEHLLCLARVREEGKGA